MRNSTATIASFLPSPHEHDELESLGAASTSLNIKAEDHAGHETFDIGALVEARYSRYDKTFHPGKIVATKWTGEIVRYTVEWDGEEGTFTPNLARAWIRVRI
jgi:hypothetical protein